MKNTDKGFKEALVVGARVKYADGKTGRIICTNRLQPTTKIVSLFVDVDNREWTRVHAIDGSSSRLGSSIIEILEPKPEWDWSIFPLAQWMAMDEDGNAYAYTVKPDFRDGYFALEDRDELDWRIPPDRVPKWDGDWKDSLTQRPEGV